VDERRSRDWPAGSLVGRLEPGTRAALLRLGTPRVFPPGTVLVGQGDNSDHVIVVHDGLVKVTAGTEEGHLVLLGIRSSGDVLGELAAMDGAPRSATLTTVERVVGQEIKGEEFRTFLREHPKAALLTTSMVGQRLRMANRRRIEFGGYTVRIKVARVLVDMGRSLGQGNVVQVPLSHRELAELTGSAVVSVQKALRQLRREGLVNTGYRHIVIQDLEGLDTAGHTPS
jgi:CRP/FNR family transcriptional regulator, cyclic AMP receptor protein